MNCQETSTPRCLEDYACTSQKQSWCNTVQIESLSKQHQKVMISQDKFVEPYTYQEASQNPKWVKAIEKEIGALNKNKT